MTKALNLNSKFTGTYLGLLLFSFIALCEYKGETYHVFVGVVMALWLASIRDYNYTNRNRDRGNINAWENQYNYERL